MQHSESIAKIAEALSKAQAQFSPVRRECENPFFKSKYADLANIIDATRKALSDNGLSYTQLTGMSETRVIITTLLMHSSGEWISGELPMPMGKQDAQGVGSAMTYGRRYALQSILGVAAEDDDDGNGATQTDSRAKQKPQAKAAPAEPTAAKQELPQDPNLITPPQRSRLFAIAKEKKWPDSELRNLLGRHGFEHSNEITKASYDSIVKELEGRTA